MKKIFILLLSLPLLMEAQTTQVIKGLITDKESKFPLIGVTVAVVDVEPIIGASTDDNGEFKLSNVPLGRHTLKITYIGYKEQTMPNVEVSAGKQTIIDFALTENVTSIDEIVVKAESDKTATNNDMTVVSARSFNLEEAQRYAGSLNDPSRMAANFAGVNGANDARNDIVIRGNSPLGLLWRLEGVEIPNPNHFGSLGSTGGPVSILNSNQLGKSDFMTSAFPANLGNATSGVFDLALRRPNNEKREHMFQIGFNGFEAGTEGPFSKKSKASFMINYRYSTLGLFKALGVDFGTGAAVPQYQDLSFKVEIPTKKAGKISFFGLGGLSNIEFYDSKIDTSKGGAKNFYNDGTQDIVFRSNMGVIGASHVYFFDENTSSKLVIAASGTEQPTKIDTIIRPEIKLFKNYEGNFATNRLTLNYSINKKWDRKNTFNTGINIDRIGFLLKDKAAFGDTTGKPLITIRDSQGANELYQAWFQWQHKFSERFTMNLGLHAQAFSLNSQIALEPRLGLKYQVNEKSSINFGAGVHNQIQPMFMYYSRTRFNDGTLSPTLSNKNLKFTNSNHVVLGYDNNFATNWRIKTEVYYQYLDRIPVESHPSNFSMANVGSDFNIPDNDSLKNKGTGYNYGAEVTLERFFSNGFYLLGTASLFESKYKGSDGVERNTAFNGNFVFNALGGYEVKLGKKSTLSINLKGSYAGGRRYTPINEAASLAQMRTIRFEDQAYSQRLPDYFRTDVTLGFKLEGKKVTQQFLLVLNNVTNNVNVFQRRYSITENKIVDVPQQALFIIPQYRILF